MLSLWMDEYAQYYFDARPDAAALADYGDISDRVALRKQLQCKPFSW